MTSCQEVYDAFLARITADDWTQEMIEEQPELVEEDWRQLLNMAIFRFKYPRCSLEISFNAFTETLTTEEIQLLALYMKHEWVKRCLASWENLRMIYTDSDFSQANYLDKLIKAEADVADEIHAAEGIYDRSRHKSPADLFKKLAGKKNVKL